jgi:MFS transporter, DHA1 family, tetracycline resistance protein
MASIVKQPSLFPILLVNFVSTLGFSIVLPFLVFLVMEFGGDAIVYGLLAATYPAFQLIGAPLLGKWSDIFGRKKVLLLSNVGTSAGWVLFLFALFLSIERSFGVNTVFFGTFVVIVPLFILFLAEQLTGLLVEIFLLPMLIFLISPQMKTGVKTLGRWQYLLISALFWVRH